MSERTDRFVIEIGSGTVAHIIDMDADHDEMSSRLSLGLNGPGEKMCSRGNRHPGDQRVPFAAGDTGRRHYRDIADHLEEMQGLVPEARFEEFVDFLKDKHSNRPAFLDELEKAGF